MRCTSPRTVGFKADGKTLAWSQRDHSKEYASFQLPCGKCLECRLDYARQWSIRCVHEAQMHEKNSFITLTYSDEHLPGPKLVYSDFQKFMKRLRFAYPNDAIGVFVTGEYGEKTKRPHWHALLFNWSPGDETYVRSNERGDRIFKSDTLDRLWGLGRTEIGSVTFESAGYCARYAAKKLVHGPDESHDFQPISKKSNKQAIGKKWLEKYFWSDCFSLGELVLRKSDGSTVKSTIPRYYEKWFKENHPALWLRYVEETKLVKAGKAALRAEEEKRKYFAYLRTRGLKPNPLTPEQIRSRLINARFEQLQKHLKL